MKVNEMEGESIIILKIGFPKKRKFMVAGYYRQFSKIFNNRVHERLSTSQQDENFENQLVQLNNIKIDEKIILGDFNIDYKIINKNEDQKNNYEKTFNNTIK